MVLPSTAVFSFSLPSSRFYWEVPLNFLRPAVHLNTSVGPLLLLEWAPQSLHGRRVRGHEISTTSKTISQGGVPLVTGRWGWLASLLQRRVTGRRGKLLLAKHRFLLRLPACVKAFRLFVYAFAGTPRSRPFFSRFLLTAPVRLSCVFFLCFAPGLCSRSFGEDKSSSSTVAFSQRCSFWTF